MRFRDAESLYKHCIEVAAWFTEMQVGHLPVVLVPEKLYLKYIPHLRMINSGVTFPFEVKPYKGSVVIAIPQSY